MRPQLSRYRLATSYGLHCIFNPSRWLPEIRWPQSSSSWALVPPPNTTTYLLVPSCRYARYVGVVGSWTLVVLRSIAKLGLFGKFPTSDSLLVVLYTW